MPADMPLGERIRRARKRLGLSQQQLADMLAVRRESVINWENGHTHPGRDKLQALQLILGSLDDEPESLAVIADDIRHARPLSPAARRALLEILSEQPQHGRHALLPAYPAGYLAPAEPQRR